MSRRGLELVLLFGALPLGLALGFRRPPVILPLLVVAGLCLAALWRD
jgi:hypothetical protein